MPIVTVGEPRLYKVKVSFDETLSASLNKGEECVYYVKAYSSTDALMQVTRINSTLSKQERRASIVAYDSEDI